MKTDTQKTKAQLIEELSELRKKVVEFEKAAAIHPPSGDAAILDGKRRAEEHLRQLAQRQEALLSEIPDIIMEVDSRKVYTWANTAGYNFFGDGVIGKEAADYFIGEQNTYAQVQPLFNGDPNLFYVESWQRRRDGESRLLAWRCRTMKDAEGRVTGALSTASDITDLRRNEEALRLHEAKYQNIVEMANEGIWAMNERHETAFVNARMAAMLGYTEEEMLGRPVETFMFEEDLPYHREQMKERHQGRGGEYERRFRRKDGGQVWTRVSASAVKDAGGRFGGSLAMVTDITESKRAEAALREQKLLLDNILNSIPAPIFYKDTHGSFLGCNSSYLAYVGLPRESILGRTVYDLYPTDLAEIYSRADQDLIRSGGTQAYETIVRHADGSAHDVIFHKAAFRNAEGAVAGIVGVILDITERKRAEEALKGSEESARRLALENAIMAEIGRIASSTLKLEDVYDRFAQEVRKLLAFDNITVLLVGPEKNSSTVTHVIGTTVAGREVGTVIPMAGTALEEIRGTRSSLLLREQDMEETVRRIPGLRPAWEAGRRAMMIVPLISKNQVIGTLNIASRRPDAFTRTDLARAERVATQIAGAIANAQLFRERERAQEELRAGEERYRHIYNNAQIGLYRARISDGMVLEANTRLAQICGYENREEFIGDFRTSEHYLDPGTRERLLAELEKKGEVQNFEARLSRKDNAFFWARLTARLFPEKGYIEGVLADITDEKLAQERLRESEERYRRLVENAPLGILSMDPSGNVIHVNSRLLSILGSPSVESTRPINVFTFPPLTEAGIADNFRRCLETGKGGVFESPYRAEGEKEIYLQYYLTPILDPGGKVTGVQAILEDISEQRKLEGQLLQAQKMEAVGTLAGGIAHDFNNILTAILGYAELASFKLPEHSEVQEDLQQCLKAGHRAKDLVQQILAFSRQGKQERKPLDIRPLIKEGLKFLRASLPATIEIREHIEGNLGVIEADPTQIHQVLMNLCTNAAHAMRDKGGILEVSLERFDLIPGLSATYPEMEPGPYLKLRISDTGHGMSPEVQRRIFDPYYTTKQVGEGTGLGLAVVHGVVKSYRGGITVSSQPGKGTTFEVFFPGVYPVKPPAQVAQMEPLPLGGHERILFVDDENAIVEIAQSIIERLGYEVEVRTSSIEAREMFRANPDRFDMVITDMTMPNMTGDRLAQEILGIRPEIPVILCTGFSEYITEERAKALGIQEFVMKPLVMRDLAKVIRRALDRKKKKKK
jgi:PAS domain S-box-containing protein